MTWFFTAPKSRKDLDSLLNLTPAPDAALFKRLAWLKDLLHWVLSESPLKSLPTELDFSTGHPQALRVKWLLHVLDRHPQWKAAAAATLTSIARETQIFDLLIRSGLHQQSGLVSEFIDRLQDRLLPKAPDDHNLELFFSATFKQEQDAMSLTRIDLATFQAISRLFSSDATSSTDAFQNWKSDVNAAISHLALNIAALGSNAMLRRRAKTTAFFDLHRTVQKWVEKKDATLQTSIAQFANQCLDAIDDVYHHMEDHGVSVDLVYHLERTTALIHRLKGLMLLFSDEEFSPAHVQIVMASLVFATVHSRSLRALIDDNTSLIAKKIVENSAETGEHYIAKTAGEERALFRGALGGGVVTTATVVFKYLINAIPGSPFLLGFISSLNYSFSFMALQLKGFSLATKQPAMTAAKLAEQLDVEPSVATAHASEAKVKQPQKTDPMVREMLYVVRSQSLTAIGNILAVIPGVFAVCWLYAKLTGHPFLAPEKALHTVEGFSILGPTPFYAAWTGVLLFSSSLAAGWFYHWVLFRQLPQALARSPGLNASLGPERTRKFALFFKKNAAGFAANISLGFLLGLSPALFQFLGLPLDVRHVTLSTGSLTAASMTLGPEVVHSTEFWLAVAGIVSMAVFNISISFALALTVALRAKRVPLRHAFRLLKALLFELFRRPWQLFWPGKAPA